MKILGDNPNNVGAWLIITSRRVLGKLISRCGSPLVSIICSSITFQSFLFILERFLLLDGHE